MPYQGITLCILVTVSILVYIAGFSYQVSSLTTCLTSYINKLSRKLSLQNNCKFNISGDPRFPGEDEDSDSDAESENVRNKLILVPYEENDNTIIVNIYEAIKVCQVGVT